MAEQPVDIKPEGQNVAGEVPVTEPEAVTDDTTVHDDDVELERTIGLVGGLARSGGALIVTAVRHSSIDRTTCGRTSTQLQQSLSDPVHVPNRVRLRFDRLDNCHDIDFVGKDEN